jgi:hypothetical protein
MMSCMAIDWKQQAKVKFSTPKPEHFTDYRHCCECAEHDQTLLAFDVDSIGLEQLGNPGWDPLCFSSPDGLIYYMPAIVRLVVDTIDNPGESYLDQMLFHLIKDGPGNSLVSACNEEQRRFIAEFLEYLISEHAEQIAAEAFAADDILRAHEIWSPGAGATVN